MRKNCSVKYPVPLSPASAIHDARIIGHTNTISLLAARMQNEEDEPMLNLANLPSDVVRKIIKAELDSIDSLKLVSITF